jgi:hypothetical protein
LEDVALPPADREGKRPGGEDRPLAQVFRPGGTLQQHPPARPRQHLEHGA